MNIIKKMFKEIFKFEILTNKEVAVTGLNKQSINIYIKELILRKDQSIIIITKNISASVKLYQDLYAFLGEKVLFFPEDDNIFDEQVSNSTELLQNRNETIIELIESNTNKILVTNISGYLKKIPNKKDFKNKIVTILKGDRFKKESLVETLLFYGYNMETTVNQTGDFSVRGYIVDIYLFKYDKPVRIEFFGDIIEDIRYFNAETQISIISTDKVQLSPIKEIILEKNSNISEYINAETVILIDPLEIKKVYSNKIVSKEGQGSIDLLEKINKEILEKRKLFIYDGAAKQESLSIKIEQYNSVEIPSFNGDFNKVNEYIRKQIGRGKTVVFALKKTSFKIMNEIKTDYVITDFDKIFEKKVNVVVSNDFMNFSLNNIIFLSEDVIFSRKETYTYKTTFKYGKKIINLNEINKGDYIIHQFHGIGKYIGINMLKKNGVKKDYLKLIYKNNDKLYVPVNRIDVISKFSSNDDYMPKLNKLGGVEWHKQKTRARKTIKNIANELIKLSAERLEKQGFPYLEDTEEQKLFESDFEYIETEDQLKAIKEIKADMEKPLPMDRLVCGDVGYGKTEVAFRAVFKAISSGKQVAYLCPTTILSIQQYNNAIKRFEKYGINIALLNRFTTQKEKTKIFNELKTGYIDFIIGTHSLFGKELKYKDLGLLIVDEEQRFGVIHKEQIKKYKSNIDVLTLSATPIPRTLQMSLAKIRGLSLIETPPIERLPIQTYVMKENNETIKKAIYNEKARGGQVFLLYNRTINIEVKVSEIKTLVPNIKVGYIHGRMNKNAIERTMLEFINKEYDVLVCTTIIETGIDIRNANTLIILDSDKFGLSQLYQIRGRIGRGNKLAYAYLMYKETTLLSETATKRLSAISEFTQLGSGYNIALKDLAIRGAGDVLGSEQSGFIDSIGYNLYLKILQEELDGNKDEEIFEEIQYQNKETLLNVQTHIDKKYIDNENLIIEVHRNINRIDTMEKLVNTQIKLKDRYGPLPEEILVYMYEKLFEVLVMQKGVETVNESGRFTEIIFSKADTKKINIKKLMLDAYDVSKEFIVKVEKDKLHISLPNVLKDKKIYLLVRLLKSVKL